MSVAAPIATRRPRLNPFLFPSDVDIWLILMIAALVAATLDLYAWIQLSSISRLEALQAACLSVRLPTSSADAQTIWLATLEKCQGTFDHKKALWMLGGAVLVLVTATLMYRLMPRYKIWRSGYQPLDAEAFPDLADRLQTLTQEAGLRQQPAFFLGPNNGAATGLAFGTGRQPSVALMAGLIQRYRRQPDVFNAVVRHELAHIRNADVGKTYFALASWWAFVVAALIPFGIAIILHPPPALRTYWDLGWRTAALIALVYLTRSAVLRQREFYADVRASVSNGTGAALHDLLGSAKQPRTGLLQEALARHPAPTARQQVLDDTAPLFRVGFWPIFGAGVTFALAFPNITAILIAALTGVSGAVTGFTTIFIASIVASLILAPLTVGVVGLALWRQSFDHVMTGQPRVPSWKTAIAIGTGTLVGASLSYESAGVLAGASVNSLLAYAAVYVVWAVSLTGFYALVIAWITAASVPWIAVLARRFDLRRVVLLGLGIATALITASLAVLFFYRTFLQRGLAIWDGGEASPALTILLALAALVLMQPLVIPAAVSIWAFPLASALPRVGGTATSTPALYLETASVPAALPRHSLQPRRVLSYAVIAAVIGLAAVWGLQAIRAQWWSIGVLLLLAVMVFPQGIAAAAAATRSQALPVVHGLIAGGIAGVLLGLGYELPRIIFAHASIVSSLQVIAIVINSGILVSLSAAWVSAWITRVQTKAGGSRPLLHHAGWLGASLVTILLVATAVTLITGLQESTQTSSAVSTVPQIPEFYGELATPGATDRFVALLEANDKSVVSIFMTCQVAHTSPTGACIASAGPAGSVILLVAANDGITIVEVMPVAGTDALVTLGSPTQGSLALSGDFKITNEKNLPNVSGELQRLNARQLILLQPVDSTKASGGY